jgi:hypothetical protein
MKKFWNMCFAVSMVLLCSLLIPGNVRAATVDGKNAGMEKSFEIITPDVITNGSEKIEKLKTHTITYDKNDVYTEEDGSTRYGAVCAVEIPEKGDFYLAPTNVFLTGNYTPSIEIGLYKDHDCTAKIASYYLSNASYGSEKIFSCQSGGRYYLKMTVASIYAPVGTDSVSFRSYFYTSADKTLKNGTWQAIAKNNSTERYYKMVLSADGHVRIQTDANESIYICNSKKEVKYDSLYLSSTSNNRMADLFLTKGTYYIKTKGTSDVSKIRYTYKSLGSSPYTLANKKSVTIYPAVQKSAVYIKYKAANTGYVTLSKTDQNGSYVVLCNSKKSALSGKDWLYGNSSTNNKRVYGVTKGKVYYFKITNTYSNKHVLKLTETKISEKSGASKAKAVKVSSGTTKKGTIQAGSKTADWYKFTITKAKKVSITLKGSSNDKLKITVYTSKGKSIGTTSGYGNAFGQTLNSYGKLAKGTYYIKIERGNSKSSGYYSLKWK